MPDYSKFSTDMQKALARAWVNAGVDSQLAGPLSLFGTYQTANESGYGSSSLAKQHNYGGLKNGKGGYQSFQDINDFAKGYVNNIIDKFPTAMNSSTLNQYMDALFDGTYKYSTDKTKEQYTKDVLGTANRVNNAIRKWKNQQH